jgi:GT2 family glycosyltransferase
MIEIVIVDNDVNETAALIVESARQISPFTIHYFVEPTRGIASARNRVLQVAIDLEADYLAFIDDDEVMKPDWLIHLLARMRETGSDAVGGPVEAVYPENAPRWVIKNKCAKGKKSKIRRIPYTNNVLISAYMFRYTGLRFDTSLRFSGGEDVDFFNRGKKRGYTYAFSDIAIVYESVPLSRLTLKWRFQRRMNVATSNVILYKKEHNLISTIKKHGLRALPRLIYGPLLIISSLFLKSNFCRGLKHTASSLGTIIGLFGFNSNEYRNIHGR